MYSEASATRALHIDMGRKSFFIRMRFSGTNVKKIALGSVNNRGARNYQEDSFGFSSIDKKDLEEYGFTAIVADGMGGLSGGAQVSDYVVSTMLDMQMNRDLSVPIYLHLYQSLFAVNNGILRSGMKGGSTAVVVTCLPTGIYWCTVGDSRVYLYRNGILTAMNEDTDYMNRLLERVITGELRLEDALRDKKKDSLAQYMGYKGGIVPDVNSKPLVPRKNDKLLLCTDGVYNALTVKELNDALSRPAGEAAAQIEGMIVAKGYSTQDNFTAIVVEFIR